MLSRAQLSFFMVALWWPLLAVLAISSYGLWIGEYTTFDSSDDPLGVPVVVGHSWAFDVFAVDVPIREEPKRATSAANGLVGAVEVHSFLRRAMDDLWRVFSLVAGPSQDSDMAVRLDPDCAVPADRRLRLCRSDGRALQDVFFMRFNTRQVTRVL